MPNPRVYVETTIPNFYYDLRSSAAVTMRREATRRWWVDAAYLYDLVTSTVVLGELRRGKSSHVPLRLALMSTIPTLAVAEAVDEIVHTYVSNKLMPANPREDALHLALASFYSCDFIVTWNCRHLANPNKRTHIHQINTRLGLRVPRLVTPADLLREGT
jgi:predicted nucleic acid-binding protein